MGRKKNIEKILIHTADEKIYESLFRKWIFDPLSYIEESIIKPYNAATGKNVFLTIQQKEAIEIIRKIVTARLKKMKNQPMNKEEIELNQKFGISIMAGKGIGKDALAAWLIIWFLHCFPYAKIPCVSVSADQLNKVLWSEIGKWLQHSLAARFMTLQNDKLFFNTSEEDMRGKRWFAFPKTANPKSSVEEQVETLSGIHEEYLMIVIDESSGIPDPVFDPLEGTLTQPCNFVFMIFNPTRSKGYAIDSQFKDSQYWVTMRWDAEESEISDKKLIERIKEKYGIDSNPWRVRIKGLPPFVDEHTLIPMDWIMEAVNREIIPLEKDPIIKGLDCGAGGDSSIIITRKGGKVFSVKRLTTQDSQVLINWANSDFLSEGGDILRVDSIGIGWAVYGGLFDRLGSKVEAADSRRQADNPEKFYNKRAEMYWSLREKFEKSLISIPEDRDLIDALSVIKVSYEGGKIKVVEKTKIKQELGRSPDEADALALSYYVSDDIIYKTQYGKAIYCHQPKPFMDLMENIPQGWLRA
ncbi:MAG: hypothetical protein ACOYWZ_20250 [Bacillota bacterium]